VWLRRLAPEPRRKDGVDGDGSGVFLAAADQAAVDQVGDGGLDGALGEPNPFGEDSVTDGDRFAAGAVGLAVQVEVDEEGGRGMAVGDEVAHEGVDDVGIQFHVWCCVL